MSALPRGWSTRRPTLDDIPDILKLAHASDIASTGEPDFTAEEVRQALTGPHTDMAQDCWLALDDTGAIVGWAYPGNPTGGSRDFVEVFVWPGRGAPAMRPLLDLMMARVHERARMFGHSPYTVRAGALPTEAAWIDALTEAGFVFVKQHARMRMSLDGVSATPPPPPPDVTVRPVEPSELRDFHEVIEEAFRDSDHRATDFDTWRAQVDAESSVSWDEWFAAFVDGRLVGALQSSDSGVEDDEGWVKYLAVLRPYRRRGVGEALLRHAFAAYAAKGRRTAGLGVDLANPTKAARLYTAVGMRPLYQANIYQVEIYVSGEDVRVGRARSSAT